MLNFGFIRVFATFDQNGNYEILANFKKNFFLGPPKISIRMAVLGTFQKMVKILTVFWGDFFCFWKKVFNSLKYQINAKF